MDPYGTEAGRHFSEQHDAAFALWGALAAIATDLSKLGEDDLAVRVLARADECANEADRYLRLALRVTP